MSSCTLSTIDVNWWRMRLKVFIGGGGDQPLTLSLLLRDEGFTWKQMVGVQLGNEIETEFSWVQTFPLSLTVKTGVQFLSCFVMQYECCTLLFTSVCLSHLRDNIQWHILKLHISINLLMSMSTGHINISQCRHRQPSLEHVSDRFLCHHQSLGSQQWDVLCWAT